MEPSLDALTLIVSLKVPEAHSSLSAVRVRWQKRSRNQFDEGAEEARLIEAKLGSEVAHPRAADP